MSANLETTRAWVSIGDAAVIALQHVAQMRLDQIQDELRNCSGKAYRFDGDMERRQQLWRRLDRLVRR